MRHDGWPAFVQDQAELRARCDVLAHVAFACPLAPRPGEVRAASGEFPRFFSPDAA